MARPARSEWRIAPGPRGGGGQTIGDGPLGISNLSVEFRLHRLVIGLERGMAGQPITVTARRSGATAQTLTIPTDAERDTARSGPTFDPGHCRLCVSVPEGTYRAYSTCRTVDYEDEMSDLVSVTKPCRGVAVLRVDPLATGAPATVEWVSPVDRGRVLQLGHQNQDPAARRNHPTARPADRQARNRLSDLRRPQRPTWRRHLPGIRRSASVLRPPLPRVTDGLRLDEVQNKREAALHWANEVSGSNAVGAKWNYLLVAQRDLRDAKGDWNVLSRMTGA